MGSCICKEPISSNDYERSLNQNLFQPRNQMPMIEDLDSFTPSRSGSVREKFPASSTVDKLVLETLNGIGSLVEKYVLLFKYLYTLFLQSFLSKLLNTKIG